MDFCLPSTNNPFIIKKSFFINSEYERVILNLVNGKVQNLSFK
jgi:hypothetical protein